MRYPSIPAPSISRPGSGRALALVCSLGLLACTASWGKVVRYSADPADFPVLIEVYRAALAGIAEEPWPDSVAVQHFGSLAPLPTSAEGPRVPNHWPDTLKHEVRVALSDPARSHGADSADLTHAAQALGLVLLPSDTTEWPVQQQRAPPPRIQLSRPGFNGDSTIAALRVDVWYGPMCCSGETLLLARKPGKRWRVWHSFLHWVS